MKQKRDRIIPFKIKTPSGVFFPMGKAVSFMTQNGDWIVRRMKRKYFKCLLKISLIK